MDSHTEVVVDEVGEVQVNVNDEIDIVELYLSNIKMTEVIDLLVLLDEL